MLDIIIPAYNAHKTIVDTLFSIVYQKFDKPFKVYVVNDASDKDYDDIIKIFKKYINIEEIILKENSGPGVARQKGLDVSTGDYIIFIDSDDVFSDCFAFRNLYNAISIDDCDEVSSYFVEETSNSLELYGDSAVWLHGKIFKRSFINKYNIKFNNSRIGEDNGFNLLLELFECKKYFLNVKTYIWRNNRNSITRFDKDNSQIKIIYGYVYNMLWALEQGIKNNASVEQIGIYSFNVLCTMYIYYLKYGKSEDLFEIYKITKNVLNISEKYDIEDKEKNEIFSSQYYFILNSDKTLQECATIPRETIYDFFNYLNSLDDLEGDKR